ncbi:DNA primase [Mycoplasmopsis ciconiae]|uniref:DNA primase n=1 Tax=Mycoplasmopsis ciconiae TaxID=561067 RepID=A0ABU7MLT1_9BACT|nr:DNA primase [Mycoplasmopsis ciconiae]
MNHNRSEQINQIINNADIVSVISASENLISKGRDYVALCPFHADSNPSMSVSTTKNIYKCFSCGAGGNALTFVKNKYGYSFLEAVKFLANLQGIDFSFSDESNQFYSNPKIAQYLSVLQDLNNYFKVQAISNQNAQEYFLKRKLDIEIRNTFNIGYVPDQGLDEFIKTFNSESEKDLYFLGLINQNNKSIFYNRVTFAIQDNKGNVVGFSARVLDDSKPKYINSPESEVFKKSQILYNYNNAQESANIAKEIIICEGFMDVIALYKTNFKNAVALMGTSLSNEHAKLLKNLKVLLFLDNDIAGLNATKKSIISLLKNNIEVNVIKNNLNKDPDEIFNTYGADALTKMIQNNQVSAYDFIYDLLTNNFINNPDINIQEWVSFEKEINEFFSYAPQNIIDFYVEKTKNLFNKTLHIQKDNNINTTNNFYQENDYSSYQYPSSDQMIENFEKTIEQTHFQNYGNLVNTNDYFSSKYDSKQPKKDKIDKTKILYEPLNKIIINILSNPDFFIYFAQQKANRNVIFKYVLEKDNIFNDLYKQANDLCDTYINLKENGQEHLSDNLSQNLKFLKEKLYEEFNKKYPNKFIDEKDFYNFAELTLIKEENTKMENFISMINNFTKFIKKSKISNIKLTSVNTAQENEENSIEDDVEFLVWISQLTRKK